MGYMLIFLNMRAVTRDCQQWFFHVASPPCLVCLLQAVPLVRGSSLSVPFPVDFFISL